MIDINLLPEALRKKERMPIQQLLGLIGAIVLFCLLGYMIFTYAFYTVPDLTMRRDDLTRDRDRLRIQAEELKKINAEIARLTEYVDAVKTLYRNRVVWSKILSDMKHIVNFDPAMSEYNNDMRYLWFTKFTGKGKNISLTGFATASDQVVAIQMPERLLQGILSYKPDGLPEKGEEARLEAELKSVVAEYEGLRRENPDLPPQGPKEIAIRERLEEIKKFKSGGVALQSFAQLLAPGSLQLNTATWTVAPQPRGTAKELTELFPKQAWNFTISMDLK